MITTAERTLAIIKPDASSKEDDIVWAITQLGFKVLNVGIYFRRNSELCFEEYTVLMKIFWKNFILLETTTYFDYGTSFGILRYSC